MQQKLTVAHLPENSSPTQNLCPRETTPSNTSLRGFQNKSIIASELRESEYKQLWKNTSSDWQNNAQCRGHEVSFSAQTTSTRRQLNPVLSSAKPFVGAHGQKRVIADTTVRQQKTRTLHTKTASIRACGTIHCGKRLSNKIRYPPMKFIGTGKKWSRRKKTQQVSLCSKRKWRSAKPHNTAITLDYIPWMHAIGAWVIDKMCLPPSATCLKPSKCGGGAKYYMMIASV